MFSNLYYEQVFTQSIQNAFRGRVQNLYIWSLLNEARFLTNNVIGMLQVICYLVFAQARLFIVFVPPPLFAPVSQENQ